MPCARHADCKAPSRLLHRRVGPRPLHRPHRGGHRRRLGAERPQDHRAPEARLHRAPLRRPREPPFRLARPRARRAGRPCLPPRALPSAAPPAGRVRRRARRLPGPRSRQARHGLRRRQDLHRAAHRGSRGGGRRPGPVPGTVDLPVLPVDAGVGDAARDSPPLRRRLLRHPGGAQRRGRLAPGARNPGHHGPAGDLRRAPGGRRRRDDRSLLHLPLARHRGAGAGRGSAALRPRLLRRSAPDHRRRSSPPPRKRRARRPDLPLRARPRRGADPGREAPLHDRDAAPLHRERQGEGGEPRRGRVLDGRSGDLRAGAPPPALLQSGRSGAAVRLQGRRARHVRTARRRRVAGASGRGRERDQPDRRREDHRLLARVAESGEPGPRRRAPAPPLPGHRVHQHHRRVEAPGSALGRRHRPRHRPAAGGRTPERAPLRHAARRRPASRPRPQGPDRVAEGRARRRGRRRGHVPHPLERALPVRGHRRAGAGRGAVHEPPELAGGHRAGRGPGHAQGARQGVRLHHPAHRGAGGRQPRRGAGRQRTLRRGLERPARAAFARRPARRRDQQDRPQPHAHRPHHLQRR